MKPTWRRRQARATTLGVAHPHAEELLAFYGQVLAIQEPLYRKAKRSSWIERVDVATGGSGPRLGLHGLAGPERDRLFQEFVQAVESVSTEVLAAIAGRLTTSGAPAPELLEAFLARQPLDEMADALECTSLPLQFFPRAFLQPVTEALAEQALQRHPDIRYIESTCCPHCGWPPQLGLLRDEPEVKGRRLLLCSLCSSEWVFPRSTCPSCGETRADQLQYHVTDFWPHVRIEECGSCHTYIKAVDLRQDGRAVPVVDELASVELDLWASDEGLEKLERNLLGL